MLEDKESLVSDSPCLQKIVAYVEFAYCASGCSADKDTHENGAPALPYYLYVLTLLSCQPLRMEISVRHD